MTAVKDITRRLRTTSIAVLTAVVARGATAQGTPADTGRTRTGRLDAVQVHGRVDNLVGVAVSPSQGTVGAADLAPRPLLGGTSASAFATSARGR